MSRPYIPGELLARVAEQSAHRCGYCLSAEAIIGATMELDHIRPLALGGETAEDNLWLACSECNDRKNDRVAAADPTTGALAALFDPRRQRWADHFAWTDAGVRIIGRTPAGRATVAAYRR